MKEVVGRSLNVSVLPKIQDWSWALDPVRDQGYSCGSCWAFTAVAIIEAHHYIKHYEIISLSDITGFALFPSGDEKKLKTVVGKIGPVGFDASLDTFVNYQSGIYYDTRCSRDNITHALLIVGYGTENGMDYWLIRNSWVIFEFLHLN